MGLTDSARLTRTGEGTYAAETDPAYWNRIGPFGGWIAALLLRSVLEDPRTIGEPLSFSINFAGAMEQGAFEIRLRELRHGRSTTFWSAELVQVQNESEMLCAFATIVMARRRETPSFIEIAPPNVPPPEGLRANRAAAAMGLAFLERLDLRFAGTNFPFPDDGETRTWVRSVDAAELDFETLTALCDSGFPQIFVKLKQPVPISSVTLNVFYWTTREELVSVGPDFLLNVARLRVARNGFFDTSTAMWSRSGALLATTEQAIWFKPPA
jgi:acyl-CoA thioesterase